MVVEVHFLCGGGDDGGNANGNQVFEFSYNLKCSFTS